MFDAKRHRTSSHEQIIDCDLRRLVAETEVPYSVDAVPSADRIESDNDPGVSRMQNLTAATRTNEKRQGGRRSGVGRRILRDRRIASRRGEVIPVSVERRTLEDRRRVERRRARRRTLRDRRTTASAQPS
jgi:hypothetical protein